MAIPSPLLRAVNDKGKCVSLARCHHLRRPAAAAQWCSHIWSKVLLCVFDFLPQIQWHWTQACGDIRAAIRIKFWWELCSCITNLSAATAVQHLGNPLWNWLWKHKCLYTWWDSSEKWDENSWLKLHKMLVLCQSAESFLNYILCFPLLL